MGNVTKNRRDHISDAEKATEQPALLTAFVRMRRRLVAYAHRFTNNADDAEDILQDAFVRLWSARPSLNDVQDASALLTTTVKNITISSWRKKQTHQEVPMEQLQLEKFSNEEDEDAKHSEDLFDEVQRLIEGQLTPIQQRVLRMRDYEQRDFETIAKELNCTEVAVRMQLSRARKKIRECYHQQTGQRKSHGE